MNNKILSVRKFKAGYELRRELVEDMGNPFEMTSAYNLTGKYIGDSKWAYRLWHKWGIKPETIDPEDNVCSIGFSEKNQKWYGWSHRAIYGFGVGDEIHEGDCAASPGYIPEYLKEHPEADRSLPIGFRANNLDDCKKMAIAFADSVS